MIRDIVKYGDPVLRTKGKRLETIDDEIRILAADMLETMYEANGVGLAAQQVGRSIRRITCRSFWLILSYSWITR